MGGVGFFTLHPGFKGLCQKSKGKGEKPLLQEHEI